MKTQNHIITATLVLIGAAACGPSAENTASELTLETAAAGAALAGDDVRYYRTRSGTLVELRGGPADALFSTLEAAGGFSDFTRDGTRYLLGSALGCLDRGARLCQIASSNVDRDVEDFVFTVHGPRFRSAASELFGAMARAEGVIASNVSQVRRAPLACAKSNTDVWCGLSDDAEPADETLEFYVRIVGLEDLGSDFVYEGWLITDDGPITSGRFDASEADETFSFEVSEAVARAASTFVLTIEPRHNDDPAPAATHILAGDFDNFVVRFGVGHGAALGTSLQEAAGSYILGVPSAPGTSYRQGIWFVDPAGPGPSLQLPTLPDGWEYEGWIVTENGPISTGRFTRTRGEDSDGAGPSAGPVAGPPFPGQDFGSPGPRPGRNYGCYQRRAATG